MDGRFDYLSLSFSRFFLSHSKTHHSLFHSLQFFRQFNLILSLSLTIISISISFFWSIFSLYLSFSHTHFSHGISLLHGLSFYHFISLSLSLSLSLSHLINFFSHPIYLYITLSLTHILSVYLSTFLSHRLSFYHFISLSFIRSIFNSPHLSIFLSLTHSLSFFQPFSPVLICLWLKVTFSIILSLSRILSSLNITYLDRYRMRNNIFGLFTLHLAFSNCIARWVEKITESSK